MEVEAQEPGELGEVLRAVREELHEPDREVEEAAGLPVDHLSVLGLGGAEEVVPPVYLHPLAAVQLQHLLREHGHGRGVAQLQRLLQPDEHDVVGRVDHRWRAVDEVSAGLAPPQLGAVLDVVDEQTGVVEHVDDLLYRRDFVLADVHPLVEAVYQLLSDILARNSDNVTIGLQ